MIASCWLDVLCFLKVILWGHMNSTGFEPWWRRYWTKYHVDVPDESRPIRWMCVWKHTHTHVLLFLSPSLPPLSRWSSGRLAVLRPLLFPGFDEISHHATWQEERFSEMSNWALWKILTSTRDVSSSHMWQHVKKKKKRMFPGNDSRDIWPKVLACEGSEEKDEQRVSEFKKGFYESSTALLIPAGQKTRRTRYFHVLYPR